MKKLLLALVLILCARSAQAAPSGSAYDRVMRTGILRCGFVPWPPELAVDSHTGAAKGPAKDLFTAIVKQAGWQVEFIQRPPGRVAADLNSGVIDAMCGDGPWKIDPTAVSPVAYTGPASVIVTDVFFRAGDKRFPFFEDLNNPKVRLAGIARVLRAGIDGDSATDLAALRFPRAHLDVLPDDTTPDQMLAAVTAGRDDAAILNAVAGLHYMDSHPGRIEALTKSGTDLALYHYGFAVRQGETALRQKLDLALTQAIRGGLSLCQPWTAVDPLSGTYNMFPMPIRDTIPCEAPLAPEKRRKSSSTPTK